MEITFTKTGPRSYEVSARRDDGVLLRVPTPDRPQTLPHDLAHYLIERGLGFERGFWGAIAAGAVFKGMQVVSGRRPPHAEERSKAIIKAEYRQLAGAEIYVSVIQGVERDGVERDWARVCARLDEAWRPFSWPRKAVTREGVLRVCEALREAEREWRELPVGQSLSASWRAA